MKISKKGPAERKAVPLRSSKKRGGTDKEVAPSKAPRSRPKNGTPQETTADIILATTEKLMLAEGYAAVSTRRVASEAGIKAPLVHYYFETTDDLFLAVFRRAVEQVQKEYEKALSSKQPLRNLWNVASISRRTALTSEFMALANHRKVIRREIAASTERARRKLVERLSSLIKPDKLGSDALPLVGMTVVMSGIGRALIMEDGVGISLGHAEVKSFVERWLHQLESP